MEKIAPRSPPTEQRPKMQNVARAKTCPPIQITTTRCASVDRARERAIEDDTCWPGQAVKKCAGPAARLFVVKICARARALIAALYIRSGCARGIAEMMAHHAGSQIILLGPTKSWSFTAFGSGTAGKATASTAIRPAAADLLSDRHQNGELCSWCSTERRNIDPPHAGVQKRPLARCGGRARNARDDDAAECLRLPAGKVGNGRLVIDATACSSFPFFVSQQQEHNRKKNKNRLIYQTRTDKTPSHHQYRLKAGHDGTALSSLCWR